MVVKKGLNFEFYVNGLLSGTTSHTQPPLSLLSSIKFGAITCCNPEVFNGTLDDFRFYSRSITQEEISYLSRN